MEVSSGRRCSVLVRGLQGCPMAKGAPFEEDSTILNICAPNRSIKTRTAKMNDTGERIGKSIVMCGNHLPGKDGATVQETSVKMLHPVCRSERHSTEQSRPPAAWCSCLPLPRTLAKTNGTPAQQTSANSKLAKKTLITTLSQEPESNPPPRQVTEPEDAPLHGTTARCQGMPEPVGLGP